MTPEPRANLSTCSEIRILSSPADFSLSEKFYNEVLKWTQICAWDREDGKGAMFDSGSGTFELLQGYGDASRITGCRISLRVADVWSLWTAINAQCEIIFQLRQNSWGDDSFCISDPNGLELVFFTERP